MVRRTTVNRTKQDKRRASTRTNGASRAEIPPAEAGGFLAFRRYIQRSLAKLRSSLIVMGRLLAAVKVDAKQAVRNVVLCARPGDNPLLRQLF